MRISKLLTDACAALALLAVIICSTMFLSHEALNSSIYRQSRIVSMLVRQDSFDAAGILKSAESIGLVLKFTGSLAVAYINFEMIPAFEATTFVAVFESVNDQIEIGSFEYNRKDLIIKGSANTKQDYENFLSALRGQDYFTSVTGDSYDSTENTVRFEIRGVTPAARAALNF